MTYLQRAEDIMDFLIVIGAMQARDDFERVRFYEKPVTTSIGPIMPRQLILLDSFCQHEDYQQYQQNQRYYGLEKFASRFAGSSAVVIRHPDYSIQQLADSLSTL